MSSRPRLPSRHRQRRARREPNEDAEHAPNIAGLQQQLLSHPGFQEFARQPDKLAAIIQSDPLLQQAAAASPELAHLLNPATMQQALELLVQPDADLATAAAPLMHRKALMQLQNYAAQLQQARVSGIYAQQQSSGSDGLSNNHSRSATAVEGCDAAPAKATDQQQHMWALVQQRFNKLQQRSQMMGPARLQPMQQQQQSYPSAVVPAGLQPLAHQQQPRVLETLVESPMAAGTPLAGVQAPRAEAEIESAEVLAARAVDAPSSTSTSSSALPPSKVPRLSDGNQTMQELLAAFPDMLGGPPVDSLLWGSHGTIGLLSAVESVSSPLGPAAAAAAGGEIAPWGTEASQQQSMLNSEVSTALPLSPHWRPPQQQQHQVGTLGSCSSNPSPAKLHSSKSAGPLSNSDPSISAAAQTPCNGDTSSRLPAALATAVMRPASALGHRILRPHSSSSVPLGSGATPLGIAQLGSGELIVDITPPTRITTQLSWSLDPDATYVLDASTSGSLVGQPSAAASTAAAAAGNEWPAGMLAPGSSSGSLCAQDSGQLSGLFGVVVSTDPQIVHSAVLASSSTAAKSSVARPAARAAGTRSGTKASAARISSSGSSGRSSNSSTTRELGSRQQTGATAATAAAAAAAKSAAVLRPAAVAVEATQQQQHQQQPHIGHTDGQQQPAHHQQQEGKAPNSSSTTQQPIPLPVLYTPHMHSQIQANPHTSDVSSHTGDGMRQSQQRYGLPVPAASRPGMLNSSSYYEDVTPSMWKPGDEIEGTGDYLDLYRRAYCSYADAFFPPVWLSLIGILASSHLLSFWQLLLVGALTFWPGMYVMAVRWAGVPSKQLSLSRVAPMMVVSLEVLCLGVSVLHIFPAMWLGHATQGLALMILSFTMLVSHGMAFMQDPGYIPLLDEEEGAYPRAVSAQRGNPGLPGSPIGSYNRSSNGSISSDVHQTSGAVVPSLQQSGQYQSPTLRSDPAAANGCAHAGKPQQGLQQQPQGYSQTPMLAGKSLTGCWTCGVEKNLRSKHCPICKRCVERFDHHCPVIGNCVGAKNHKTFVTYLMTLVICQLLFIQLLGGMLVTQHVTQLRHTHYDIKLVPEGIGQHAGPSVLVGGKLRALLLLSLSAATAAPPDLIRSDLVSISQHSAATSTTAAADASFKVPDDSTRVSDEGAATTSESVSDNVRSGVTGSASNRQLTTDAAAGNIADYSANIVLPSTTAAGIDGHEPITVGAHVQQLPNIAAAATAVPLSRASQTARGSEAVFNTPRHEATADTAAAAAGTASSSSRSRAANVELLLAKGSWSWAGCWLLLQALYAAAESRPGSLLLLLLQGPALFLSCSLLLRALFLAAANLTVNEWLNRHRYLYLQHTGAGFCNRFDRGPAHNCWEFWCGPAVLDWWQTWQQADEEMNLMQQSVLTPHSATVLVRFWDLRWAKYQQKLTVARDRRRERQLQRQMVALGLADNTIYE